MGLIRSLFYSTDFALRDDVTAEHLRCQPNRIARKLVFKMRFVDGLCIEILYSNELQ